MPKPASTKRLKINADEAKVDVIPSRYADTKLIARRILVLSNILRRTAALRYRRLLGISGSEWGLIAEVGHSEPRTLNDLAASLGIDKTRLSRTVSTLAEAGFLQRRVNPIDNRESFISLTKAGRRSYGVILEAGTEANEILLEKFTDSEREAFVDQIECVSERARHLLKTEQEIESSNV